MLLHALTRPEGDALRALAEISNVTPPRRSGPAWDIRWVDGTALGEERKAEDHYTDRPEETEPDEDLSARLAGVEVSQYFAGLTAQGLICLLLDQLEPLA